MDQLLLLLLIGALAGGLTVLGAILGERVNAPRRVITGALQFAAGVLTALVAFTLMPKAVAEADAAAALAALFAGGVVYVGIERAAQRLTRRSAGGIAAPGLYVGILLDLFIDGVVIGIGATLTLLTGLVMAVGIATHTAPFAFVTIATARRQGVAERSRRMLTLLFGVTLLAGALVGFLLLRNASLTLRLILVAAASGLLISAVTQGMIPEAHREGEPGLSGLLFTGGLALYGLAALAM